MLEPDVRRRLQTARVARLATADEAGRPHVVPVCFALVEAIGDEADWGIVTPIDEKPKRGSPASLRRSRDIRSNPTVSLLVDEYTEDWSELGWMQVRGRATLLEPGAEGHARAVSALEAKYDQYAEHDLDARPVINVNPGSVLRWSAP